MDLFAEQFPSTFSAGASSGGLGIPAVPPTKLHSVGVRDTSYSGHSFDSFYYHLGKPGDSCAVRVRPYTRTIW